MPTAAKSTTARAQLVDEITAIGGVAVIRMQDADKLIHVAAALKEGGIGAIEVTMTVPNAIAVIEQVARAMGDDILLGVGTVVDAQTAHDAINAGARYVVSPVFKPEIIDAAHKHGAPAMPGCFTPTEAQLAHEAGADVIKVFPANIVGMAFFKAVKAPLPHLKLMPTGGVSLTNAGDWIRAGACAVGVGSALLDKQAIAEGNYAKLTENARTLAASIAEGRAG